ncbi:hypothetical protein HNQ56_000906 [Anaerotaenia torta]|uniref:SHOCT-like domain-containing protein n=1 Tax=Anaerotaenia torta TaxID=433293 RepID=UPI003D2607AD
MSEQLKILEMIEKGQITAAEGMELLEALKQIGAEENRQDSPKLPRVIKNTGKYKFLKIRVSSDNSTVNVNVNVPLQLLTTIGEIATRMTGAIPNDARAKMESKGIDITSIDFSQIIDDIINGTLEDPDIIDVEAWSEEENSMIKVKIYVE